MNSVHIIGRCIARAHKRSSLKSIPVLNNKFYSSDVIVDPPDEPGITIPRPKSRENEPLEQRKARLIYQSRKRGMLENDLLLSTFVSKYLGQFNAQQIDDYDKLINSPSNDWDIYYWATDVKPTPKEYDHEVMNLLKLHSKNIHKESRIRQPDLY